MKKLFKKLATIPNDKLLHFFYGSLITYGLIALEIELIVILVIVLGVGFAKEVYDKINTSVFNFADILFTIASPLILFLIDKL
jgi:hypothetical protein